MEHETLFTATKWDILEALSTGRKSPFQLSQSCNTSLANVSQQLRLLELGGVVEAERVPNRDKGQPRVLYSLKGDNAFIIATMPGFVKKMAVPLSDVQKGRLKIWLMVDSAKQYFVETVFADISEHFENIDAVYYDPTSYSNVHFMVVPKKDLVKTKLRDSVVSHKGVKFSIKYSFKSKDYEPSSSMIKLYGNKQTKQTGERGGK